MITALSKPVESKAQLEVTHKRSRLDGCVVDSGLPGMSMSGRSTRSTSEVRVNRQEIISKTVIPRRKGRMR